MLIAKKVNETLEDRTPRLEKLEKSRGKRKALGNCPRTQFKIAAIERSHEKSNPK
jgi:hypothetical protein